jgi:magnesium-transporting ATPase (P-type)
MATIHQWNGRYQIAVKGAPEAALKVCQREFTTHGDRDLGGGQNATLGKAR